MRAVSASTVGTVGLACKERLRRAIEASSHIKIYILIHFSSGKGQVIIGPDHGWNVDVLVEQGPAQAWLDLTITHAPWIACVLAAMHASDNGAVIPGWCNQHRCGSAS